MKSNNGGEFERTQTREAVAPVDGIQEGGSGSVSLGTKTTLAGAQTLILGSLDVSVSRLPDRASGYT